MKNQNKKQFNKPHSKLDFKFMSFFFRIRDIFKPPIQKLIKAELKYGDVILDYGCGPGSYTLVAAEIVGPTGTIYAADINPFAIEKVKSKLEKKHLNNIKTTTTDCKTGLDKNSIDKIICFDTFHDINDKDCVLQEFYRVLKTNGLLALDDHHLSEDNILNAVTSKNFFRLQEKKDKVYLFTKIEN
ncbi:MAG: class I SAM-dependent methyltransferase [Candidatus Hodarchaeota archaeon]